MAESTLLAITLCSDPPKPRKKRPLKQYYLRDISQLAQAPENSLTFEEPTGEERGSSIISDEDSLDLDLDENDIYDLLPTLENDDFDGSRSFTSGVTSTASRSTRMTYYSGNTGSTNSHSARITARTWAIAARDIVKIPKRCMYLAELQSYARKLIRKTRVESTFQVAIVGPDRGGKSTFLSFVHQRMVTQIAQSGLYPTCFIFYWDFRNSPTFDGIIKAALELVGIQKPEISPYITRLIRYLSNADVKPFPNTIDVDINIARKLHSLLGRIRKLQPLQIPKKLSECFGFTKMHYVFDHFVLEHQNILANNSYVIAISQEELNRKKKAPLPAITFFNISDMRIHKKELEFTVSFKLKDGSSIDVNEMTVGGCTAFLMKWEALGKTLNRMRKEEERIDELHALAIDQSNDFIRQLIGPDAKVLDFKLKDA